jgi:exonuclease VII small subunit
MRANLSGNQTPPPNMPLSAVQASLCNVRKAQEQTVKLLGEMLLVLQRMEKSMNDANEKYEKAMEKADEAVEALANAKKELQLDRLERVELRNARIMEQG